MNTSMIFLIAKNDEGTQYRGIRNTNIIVKIINRMQNNRIMVEEYLEPENIKIKNIDYKCYTSDGKVHYQEHGSDPRNYRVSFEKVKSVLGFEPKYTIKDGVEELVNAINNHVFDHVDENRNFYGNYEINYPIPS